MQQKNHGLKIDEGCCHFKCIAIEECWQWQMTQLIKKELSVTALRNIMTMGKLTADNFGNRTIQHISVLFVISRNDICGHFGPWSLSLWLLQSWDWSAHIIRLLVISVHGHFTELKTELITYKIMTKHEPIRPSLFFCMFTMNYNCNLDLLIISVLHMRYLHSLHHNKRINFLKKYRMLIQF